jgi:hypothetical protein
MDISEKIVPKIIESTARSIAQSFMIGSTEKSIELTGLRAPGWQTSRIMADARMAAVIMILQDELKHHPREERERIAEHVWAAIVGD